MDTKTLKFKVGLYLAIALTLAMVAFIVLVARTHRAHLLNGAIGHVTQLSEVVTKSTRFAMLQNQSSYVHRIIEDVGSQEGIVKVRIMSKDGTIIHSSFPEELGLQVDTKAEACFHCHESETPLEQIPEHKRSRIFQSSNGSRLLGSMEVIRNEPSCFTASCHVHSKDQSVLGVLDIVYSLDEIDHNARVETLTIAGFSVGFVIIASLFVSFFVHRMVYVPLRDLEAGADRLASGNLQQPIPVRSRDEFGQLAISFNAMTGALNESQKELQEWGNTLEHKVREKTKELQAAEAESAHREKLASVGLLAAGIAHELNNPLTGVLTFSTLVREKMEEGSTEAEDLDLVIRETNRCATIIRRLLDFARQKTPKKEFANLNTIIEETQQLIQRPAYFSDTEITMDLDLDLPPIWLDVDLIKQVIMNILVNAQQAIEGGAGRITIRSRVVPEARNPEVDPGPLAEISIADTGCGISEKDRQRIFDPFFTSKGLGKGTGLGLSVSHGIVRAHGGTIEVDSKVGEGSTFRIYLPLETQDTEVTSIDYERQDISS
ncbi:MAG: ATP-binding protein [Gammaproteobacteria bacterium]|nr:ATP-binding protein [Gammaproteobacteria bacterium]MDH3464744.1 ATP-binding protein [Gammaproteobacteria bacterium]